MLNLLRRLIRRLAFPFIWGLAWLKLASSRLPYRVLALAVWPLIAIGLIAYGASLVHQPSGYIAAGSLMLLDMYYSRHLAHRVTPQ